MNEADNILIGETLTPKQELFCRNYTQNYELFGNATLSYAEAYGHDLESQSKEDSKYEYENGTIYSYSEIDADDSLRFRKAKLIEKSSYQTMYDLCSSYGSRMRRNDKIQARCRTLLNEFLVDNVIDARLAEIILKGDDNNAISAIKEYNKLKQRIVEARKIEHSGTVVGIEIIRNDGGESTDKDKD